MSENLSDLQKDGRLCRTQFGVKQQSPTFLASGTSFMEDNFSMGWCGGMVLGWFKHITLKLTSSYATQFLTHPRPVLVLDPEVGDPWGKVSQHKGQLKRLYWGVKDQVCLINNNTKRIATELWDHKISNSVCSVTLKKFLYRFYSANKYWKFQTFTGSYPHLSPWIVWYPLCPPLIFPLPLCFFSFIAFAGYI